MLHTIIDINVKNLSPEITKTLILFQSMRIRSHIKRGIQIIQICFHFSPVFIASLQQHHLTSATKEEEKRTPAQKERKLSPFYRNFPLSWLTIEALRLASRKRSSHSATSASSIPPGRPFTRARILAGVSNCRAYRMLTLLPCSETFSSAGSVMLRFSVLARRRMMVLISSGLYGWVGMMRSRARRSGGMPWAALMSSVPRMTVFPRFEARITIGEIDDSRARFK